MKSRNCSWSPNGTAGAGMRSEGKGLAAMPAKSKVQKKAAGAALAAKRGEQPKCALKGTSRDMHDSMTKPELERLAKAKRKALPRKVGSDRA